MRFSSNPAENKFLIRFAEMLVVILPYSDDDTHDEIHQTKNQVQIVIL